MGIFRNVSGVVFAGLLAVGAAAPIQALTASPPADYQGQWWTHPVGCEYSRAGRPGEVVWFLIINTARPGCPTYIATKTWGGIYAAQGPLIRN